MESFENLKNYYFVRLFARRSDYEYFLEKGLYMNSPMVYHNTNNSYQGDSFECGVRLPEGKLCVKNDNKDFVQIGTTGDVDYVINGYIYCFFMLRKDYLQISEDSIKYAKNIKDNSDLYKFITEYNSQKSEVYGVVLDAQRFMQRFNERIENFNDCGIIVGEVDYVDLDLEYRIKQFQNNEYNRIVFTKDKKYEYQHEYRIFICKKNCESKYIEIDNLPIKDIAYIYSK